jgi:hypothetical protein
MNTEQQSEQPIVNQRVLAELNALEQEAATEQQTESAAAFDTSPIGLWQAAIRDCVPSALSIVPDLAVTEEETEALATGLAPALAKHFPISEAFTLPVEIVAIATIYAVFNPKISAIRAKRAAAELKEVNVDAAPIS